MKEIKLTQNKVAIIDDKDYDLISQFKWCAVNYHGCFYASTEKYGKTILMHRLILDVQKGTMIDHIDHDGLNNCRNNIRICTPCQNARNSSKSRFKKSKYKGVWFDESDGKKRIRSGIRINGKLINLGSFKSEHDAGLAYDEAAKKYFGEFANINNISNENPI